MTSKAAFIALASVSVLCQSAMSQTAYVASTQPKIGNWTFVPIMSTSPSSGTPRVRDFLALAHKPSVASGSIVSVWYHRQNDSDEWTMKAWTEESQWAAIEGFKASLGIVGVSDDVWPTADAKSGVVTGSTPAPYAKGVMLSDPLGAVLAVTPERDAVVSFLADIGYKAADVPVEKLAVAQCGTPVDDQIADDDIITSPDLSIVASAVEMGETATIESRATTVSTQIVAQTQLRIRCCLPWLTVGPWGPCFPAGTLWKLTGSGVGTGGIYNCSYEQVSRCTRSRTWVFVYPNCSTSTWTESENIDTVLQSKTCDNPGQGACPATPGC